MEEDNILVSHEIVIDDTPSRSSVWNTLLPQIFKAGSAVDTDSDLVVDSDLVRESNEATPAMRVAMETSRMSNEDDVYSGFEEVEEDSRQLQVSFAQSSGPDPVILSEPDEQSHSLDLPEGASNDGACPTTSSTDPPGPAASVRSLRSNDAPWAHKASSSRSVTPTNTVHSSPHLQSHASPNIAMLTNGAHMRNRTEPLPATSEVSTSRVESSHSVVNVSRTEVVPSSSRPEPTPAASSTHPDNLCRHHDNSADVTSSEETMYHPCKTCGKVYRSSAALRKHKRVKHPSGPLRVYRCAVCAKAFAEKHRAARHRREVHDRQDRLPCLLCESTFKTNSALNLHLKRRHTGVD